MPLLLKPGFFKRIKHKSQPYNNVSAAEYLRRIGAAPR
jgi:hypothetical protein